MQIIGDHSRAGESGRGCDAGPHQFGPALGTFVPKRKHFVLEHGVDVFCVPCIVSVVFSLSDGPSVDAVLAALWPPTVEDGTVWNTVHGCFHAGCTRGFQRANRVVEPDVYTAGHRQAGVHVVVFNEGHGDVVGHLSCRGEDVPNQLFSTLVFRVRFSTEHELDTVGPDGSEPFEVAEDQVGALVGCETACKANGQSVFVEFHTGGGADEFSEHAPVGGPPAGLHRAGCRRSRVDLGSSFQPGRCVSNSALICGDVHVMWWTPLVMGAMWVLPNMRGGDLSVEVGDRIHRG